MPRTTILPRMEIELRLMPKELLSFKNYSLMHIGIRKYTGTRMYCNMVLLVVVVISTYLC